MSSVSSTKNDLLIADTGPLLALARIDLFHLLPQLFESCQVTRSVLDECLAKPKRADTQKVREAVDKQILTLVPDPDVRKALAHLDQGEQTAIEMALQNKCTLLIDDRNARQAAKRLKIKIIGTVGILLLAKRNGLIEEVKPYLLNLVSSGYRLGDPLLRRALELANE